MQAILYYIHDPMCSWCWGFRSVWDSVQAQLPESIAVKYILGGLAPDSDEPMPTRMQRMIQSNWLKVQEVIPEAQFNFDFWTHCKPRRSTYPACRAVIAAKTQGDFEREMINAIQRAYYLNAQNPSDEDTLVKAADSLGLNVEQFKSDLHSEETEGYLYSDFQKYHELSQTCGAQGFPSLVLSFSGKDFLIPRNYTDPEILLSTINSVLSEQ